MPPPPAQRPYAISDVVFFPAPSAGHAHALAIGDVSGDGRDDLVFLSYEYAPNPQDNRTAIYVAYQGTGGRLGTPVRIGDSGNNLSYQLLLADMDRDGIQDVVTATVDGVMVLRSNGDGTFAVHTGNTGDPYDLVVSDVDRDGNLDVLVDASDAFASLLHGDGHGGISTPGDMVALPSSSVRTTGDVTGDGIPDLILGTVFNRPLQEFRIYPGLPGGGYDRPTLMSLPQAAHMIGGLAVGDFNSDGRSDLVVMEAKNSPTSLHFYFQDAQHALVHVSDLPTYDNPYEPIAADLDRDGRTDLALVHTEWSKVGFQLQRSGGFTPETLVEVSSTASYNYAFATGDLNHDGCTDLAFARTSQSPVLMYGKYCHPPLRWEQSVRPANTAARTSN